VAPSLETPTFTAAADAERARRDAEAAEAARRARDAAASQLKGLGGAPAAPAQSALKGAPPPAALKSGGAAERPYTFVGHGLSGGTTWRTGFYSPVGASAKVREHALQRWREQARLNGGPDDTTIDTDRYNFVIGVAASTSAWRDLVTRVMFDQLHNGAYTRNNANSLFDVQEGYNSLKGKRFVELGCHSNGVMICLAALVNRDIAADRVVLYGPQVTPESLRIWNSLVVGKQIKSLTIYVNENEPVAPMAMLANGSPPADQALLAGAIFYRASALRSVILSFAPRATLRAYACGSSLSVQCHDMARYTAASKCDTPAGAVVGTTVNGRAAAAPPSPACTRIP
jgi:hypothetical protein